MFSSVNYFCVVNDTKKIPIFSIKVSLFVRLKDPYVLNKTCVNNASVVVRYTQLSILLGV